MLTSNTPWPTTVTLGTVLLTTVTVRVTDADAFPERSVASNTTACT